MDGDLLLVAANENCNIEDNDNEKEENKLDNSILKNVIIIQNKIDTVMKYNTAKDQYEQIKKYTNNKNVPNSPII